MYLLERLEVFPDGYKQLFYYELSQTLSVSISHIADLFRKKVIHSSDIEMISFLFEFNMATLNQLQDLFGGDTLYIKQRLDKLVKYRLLNKFCLADGERVYNENSLEIYTIDKGGAELLKLFKNGNDFDNFKISRIMLPSIKVSKNLILVDFYIKLLESCPNKLRMFQVNPTTFIKGKKLIPNFGLCIQQDEELKFFIGDIVYSYDVSPLAKRTERFTEKLIQFDTLLCTNVYKKNFGEEKPPTLLIITENDETMERTAQLLSTTDISKYTQFRLTTISRLKNDLGKKGVFYSLRDNSLVSAPNKIFVE